MLECIYLHGFASGPSSTKAKYFSRRLAEAGIRTYVPNLNEPSFEDMTLTSQLSIIEDMLRVLAQKDVVLMGSSMGGLLATLAGARHDNVKALVLLAPGFGLARRWDELLGVEQLAGWEARGFHNVMHHAYGKEVPLKYGFIEDASQHQTDGLKVDKPVLIMHGKNDIVVPPEESEAFARDNERNVELHLLESDHALTDVMDQMWELTTRYLQGFLLLQ